MCAVFVVLLLLHSSVSLVPELQLDASVKLIDVVGSPYFGDDTLEGSGVFYRSDLEEFFVVCDNLWQKVLDVDSLFSESESEYITLDNVSDIEEYEGITYHYNSSTYYMVTEDVSLIGPNRYQGRVLSFDENFNLLSQEFVDYTFRDSNKGFEGIATVTRDNQLYVLVICEGNSCKGDSEGTKPGNGTILVLREPALAFGKWQVVDSIQLPEITAGFEDYAGLDVYDNKWIAVVSQTDSKLWVGELDPDSWAVLGDGLTFDFPKTSNGKTQFCNVEGVSWMSKNQIVVTTDQNSDSPCDTYAESLCIFTVLWP